MAPTALSCNRCKSVLLDQKQKELIEYYSNTTGNCSSVAEPDFTAQLSITEKAAILSNGAAIIQSVAATIAAIASTIKDASDNKSCAVISGNINGVQYQYSASGRNCNTTSQEKTIKAAVDRAITFMKNQNVDAACFQLTHGGTWKGLLQIATGGERIVNNKCLGISFPINV